VTLRPLHLAGALLVVVTAAYCSRARAKAPASPLISAKTTMVTAWQIPLDPTKDASLTDTRMAE
jgi:hypothetical protein